LPSLNPIGTPFVELLSVESTNNYAMGLVRAGMASHGTAVFAHDQTKGKGQRNKQWDSEGSKNIAISLVIEPGFMNGRPMFLLSMMTAVGVVNFFNNYIADELKIKWPNDIYWRDRKAAGILIENGQFNF
jgi:BirA family biotin operon repressor/biotin-[acetyl-CoA-carboxylase] ligase